MNTLTFVGKISKINYSDCVEIESVNYFQIYFYEKYNNKINYFHCYLPKRIFDEFEDFLNEGTILEVLAHMGSNIVTKSGVKEIEQKIFIDKVNFFELNEDVTDIDLVDFDLNEKNLNDDIPF